MRKMKRALSLILCCVMLMSLVTINTFAAETGTEAGSESVSPAGIEQPTENVIVNNILENTGDITTNQPENQNTEPVAITDTEGQGNAGYSAKEETLENTAEQGESEYSAKPEDTQTDSAADSEETEKKGAPDGTAFHMDIGIWTYAYLTVGDEVMEKAVILNRSDFKSNVEITAKRCGRKFTGFSADFNKISKSTGSSGTVQFRIPGKYPVGTKKYPVIYTIVLKKDVTFLS